jgi:uncharacterized protein YbaP (TraB family)
MASHRPLSSRLRRLAAGLGLSAFAALSFAQDTGCPAAAQAPTQAEVEAGMKAARDRGFLWRIRKDGRTSFLYGTVHVGRAAWAYPGPRLSEAVRASSTVALEMDMLDPVIVQAMQAGLAEAPRRPLPAALEARLKAQLKAACLPEEMLSAMSPEMLVTTLVVFAARRDGLDAAWGIDAVYAGLARGLKRPVVSLETPAQQFAVLQGATPTETVDMVRDGLDDLESPKLRAMIRRLAEDWAEGRLDDLSAYESWCDCLKTPAQRELFRRMLDERNPAMADKIDALHARGERVFTAVGSLHMIGPTGLPALMAARGYQVERVAFAAP